MDQCYNRILIMLKENSRLVDPFTRQTFQSADLQDCYDKQLKLFQLDVDDDKSWIELTPQITTVTGTYLFKPKEIIQQIKRSSASSQGTSIYTYAQKQNFWNMISDNSEYDFRDQRNTAKSIQVLSKRPKISFHGLI